MKAAGLQGPFFGETKTYSWPCLVGLGVIGKTAGVKGGNYLAGQAPGWAAKAGFSEAGVAVVGRGAAAFSHPLATIGFLGPALAKLAEECECNKK